MQCGAGLSQIALIAVGKEGRMCWLHIVSERARSSPRWQMRLPALQMPHSGDLLLGDRLSVHPLHLLPSFFLSRITFAF